MSTKKICVTYTRIPTNFNDHRSVVVEVEAGPRANDDAIAIIKDYLRDLGCIANYVYYAESYVPPPAGKILGELR